MGDAQADEERHRCGEVQTDGVVGQKFGLDGQLVEAQPGVDGMEGGDEEEVEGGQLDEVDAEVGSCGRDLGLGEEDELGPE